MAKRVPHDRLKIPERHVAIERDGFYPSDPIDLIDAVYVRRDLNCTMILGY